MLQIKHRITNLKDGFDFLGINFRDYGGIVLTKPSKDSIKSFKEKVKKLFSKALWNEYEGFHIVL